MTENSGSNKYGDFLYKYLQDKKKNNSDTNRTSNTKTTNTDISETKSLNKETNNKFAVNKNELKDQTSTSENGSNKVLNVNFDNNKLSETANNTYKFTWFITPPALFNGGDPRKEENQKIIIAESGKSGRYFIKDVEIDSVIAPTFKLKSSQHNSFSINIVEPKGFSLMDAILGACESVGIPNYMFAPYYLQLDFLEYDEDGNHQIVENSSKLWAIKIVSMNTSTSSEGTEYQISAIEYEHLAMSNHIAITDTNYLVGGNTIGEFFQKFQKAINVEKQDQTGLWREIPDQVKFEVDPEIAALKIKSADDRKYGPQNQDDTVFWLDQNRINIPKGMSMESIISNLMVANYEWTEKYLKKIEAQSKTDNTQESDNFHKIWMLDTNIEIGEFDYYVNDFSKTYVFKIKPYTSLVKLPDPVEISNSIGNKDKQEEKLKKIIQIFNLRKRYDFIYTGENTEVIDLNMDLNFLWVSHVPIYRGINLDNSNTDGPEVDPSKINQKTLPDRIKGYRSQLRQAQSVDEAVDAQRNLDRAYNELDVVRSQSGLLTREDTERLRSQLEASKNRSRNNPSRFADTLIGTSSGRKTPKESPVSSPNPATVVIDGGYAGNDFAWLYDGTTTKSRSVAASILNTIQSPDMLQIDLAIKGDPYWMGVTRTEDRLGIKRENEIDTYQKDNLFALRFRFPTNENEDGFQLSENSAVVTGIYGVIGVTHSFSEGTFTQTLSAFKDYTTNVLQVPSIMGNNNV